MDNSNSTGMCLSTKAIYVCRYVIIMHNYVCVYKQKSIKAIVASVVEVLLIFTLMPKTYIIRLVHIVPA